MVQSIRYPRAGVTRYRIIGAVPALLASIGLGLTFALPASGQVTTTRIRMAHLSYGTAPADVYLTSFDGQEKLVLAGLAFGQVSQYLALAPGAYTATLRPAGAAPNSPAMLTASADLAAGSAYTFAVFGPDTKPTPKLVDDQLAPPTAGAGRVRVVQAADRAAYVDVKAVDGANLAENAAFGTVTDYTQVPAGNWTIQASAAGQPTVQKQLSVSPGTDDSLIVYDAPGKEGIQVESVVDATGMGAVSGAGQSVPAGGVQTGAGGTAPAPNRGVPLSPLALVGLLVGVTASCWMVTSGVRRAARLRSRTAPAR